MPNLVGVDIFTKEIQRLGNLLPTFYCAFNTVEYCCKLYFVSNPYLYMDEFIFDFHSSICTLDTNDANVFSLSRIYIVLLLNI